MPDQDSVCVAMVSTDTVGLTAASLDALRRHFDGRVELLDVSRGSEFALREVAAARDCAYRKLPAFPAMYSHAVAMDLFVHETDAEIAVMLDNDCFIESDGWLDVLIEEILHDDSVVATGHARRPLVFQGMSYVALETWCTAVRVAPIRQTGLSLMPRVPFTEGEVADTLDMAAIVLQATGHRVLPVPIDDHAFHVGAVTVGAYFLQLFERIPDQFDHFVACHLPFAHEGFLARVVCRGFRVLDWFDDPPCTRNIYDRFLEGLCKPEHVQAAELELETQVFPRLAAAGARTSGP